MKERIIKMLMSTGRAGMDGLIKYMEENGFFESPCSGGNHLACEGGLAKHSLNVLGAMKDMSFLLCDGNRGVSEEMQNAIIICSLLHDIGKMGDFGKPGYVENILKSGKQSEAKPYEVNKDLIPVDHEIRSVNITSKFITLTEDEYLAILWHNGLYGSFKYQIPGKETKLYMLLHFADMWASRVMERSAADETVQNINRK